MVVGICLTSEIQSQLPYAPSSRLVPGAKVTFASSLGALEVPICVITRIVWAEQPGLATRCYPLPCTNAAATCANTTPVWGPPSMAAQQVSGVKLATGNIAAHFDPATPPLKLALRLPAAARRTVGGLLAATGA